MVNLFEKRATEYLRDSDSFLALITPEPLTSFLEPKAKDERLYDRLALIIGTPGSGKTTMATVLQFNYVDALRRNQTRTGYKELVSALTGCRALDEDGRPTVLGLRLPLEAEYRDFWQLPYSAATRTRLALALIQARAILGWARAIEQTGQYAPDQVRIIARVGSEAATQNIGGLDIASVRRKAAEVEEAIYRVGAALVPPATEAEFPDGARAPYRPFDVIESIEVQDSSGTWRMRPLIMLDDAHTLHPEQLVAICRDLARRELRIARWVLTRLDVLSPQEALLTKAISSETGLQLGRDVTEIPMQKGADRNSQRKAFRRMAQDMANRYLKQMPEFSRRGHERFADLLETEPDRLLDSSLKKLEKQCDKVARDLGIGAERRGKLEAEIERYARSSTSADVGRDVQLGMLLILMNRFAKRMPQGSLFDMPDLEPPKPVVADAGVAEAARIHLLHDFNRAHYYGIDAICDASSENAEQFLRLAARLVSRAETRLLRGRTVGLDSRVQHTELVQEAGRILEADFPFASDVRLLVSAIAAECKKRSLESNASLDGGATAVGILQRQFEEMPRSHPRLARVLQFAVAYNVLTLAQDYGQGGKQWCLLELGGCVLLQNGLTLKRGGFLERTPQALAALLSEQTG